MNKEQADAVVESLRAEGLNDVLSKQLDITYEKEVERLFDRVVEEPIACGSSVVLKHSIRCVHCGDGLRRETAKPNESTSYQAEKCRRRENPQHS